MRLRRLWPITGDGHRWSFPRIFCDVTRVWAFRRLVRNTLGNSQLGNSQVCYQYLTGDLPAPVQRSVRYQWNDHVSGKMSRKLRFPSKESASLSRHTCVYNIYNRTDHLCIDQVFLSHCISVLNCPLQLLSVCWVILSLMLTVWECEGSVAKTTISTKLTTI